MSGSRRRGRPSRRREHSGCDSNPGRGGWGRRPATANPSRRRRLSVAVRTGCRAAAWRGGLGPPLGRAPRPRQLPGHGWGRVLRAVHAGEAENTFGKSRTASPLGGVWGALTSGLARPSWGGRSGIPSLYVATGPRSPQAKSTNRGIKRPWVRYLMVFFT